MSFSIVLIKIYLFHLKTTIIVNCAGKQISIAFWIMLLLKWMETRDTIDYVAFLCSRRNGKKKRWKIGNWSNRLTIEPYLFAYIATWHDVVVVDNNEYAYFHFSLDTTRFQT